MLTLPIFSHGQRSQEKVKLTVGFVQFGRALGHALFQFCVRIPQPGLRLHERGNVPVGTEHPQWGSLFVAKHLG